MLITNNGLVENGENDMAECLIFDFINTLGELDWWH
jgi:hypothetical protein